MRFNTHGKLQGAHAFLSASQYHWLNDDDAKLIERFKTWQAAARGTALHDLAHRAIELGVKLPRTPKTLNMYVNDAIGYRMKTEQVLFYSLNCFGTADAISYRKNLLRIHDYKSGVTKASFSQLMVYAAIFCLEYDFRPASLKAELRIYQNDEIRILEPEGDDIAYVVDQIIRFDKLIDQMKLEME